MNARGMENLNMDQNHSPEDRLVHRPSSDLGRFLFDLSNQLVAQELGVSVPQVDADEQDESPTYCRHCDTEICSRGDIDALLCRYCVEAEREDKGLPEVYLRNTQWLGGKP